MKLPKLEQNNTPEFLEQAFDERRRNELMRGARVRRNIYVGIFFVALTCVIATSLADKYMLMTLALFLAPLSIVVITKYDTQLRFLRILDEKKGRQEREDEDRSHMYFEQEHAEENGKP